MAATLITFTQAQVDGWVETAVWPLTRILAFISVAPFFSSSWLPTFWRLGFGVAVTWAIIPTLPTAITWPGMAVAVIITTVQMVIGVSLGLLFRAMLGVIELAAGWIALSMGLGFATTVSQQYGEQSNTLSELFSFGVLLLLIADGAVLGMLHVLAKSFQVFPVGFVGPNWSWLHLANYGQVVFTDGILIALPAIMMVLVANLGMAVIARVAPQINLFAIGFPILILVGMAGLYALIPWLPRLVEHLFSLTARMA